MDKYSRKTTTKWHLFFHLCSFILNMVSGIFLIPIYLKYISLDLYGAWAATGNVLVWLTLLDPGLSEVLTQRSGAAYGKKDNSRLSYIIGSGLSITCVIVLVFCLVFLVIAPFVPGWVNIAPGCKAVELKQAFVIAALGSALMLLSYSVTALNLGLLSAIGVGCISLAASFIRICSILLLLYLGLKLQAIAWGTLIFALLLLFGNIFYLAWRMQKEQLVLLWSRKMCRELINLMSFSFLSRMGGVFCSQIDLFISAVFISPDSAAMLKFTKTAPELGKTLITRPSLALLPALSHLSGEDNKMKVQENLYLLFLLVTWGAGLLFGGLIYFNKYFILLWLGAGKYPGDYVGILVCTASVVQVFTFSVGNFIFAVGKIKQKNLIQFSQAVLYVPLVIIATKYYGLVGCVAAQLISTVIVCLIAYIVIFIKLLDLSKLKTRLLCVDVMTSFVGSALLVLLFRNTVNLRDWLDFSLFSLLFCLLYLAVLIAVSQNLRTLLVDIIEKIKTHKKIING